MATNYGLRKAIRRTYIPGRAGAPAYAGQPYVPARVVTETVMERKWVPNSPGLGGWRFVSLQSIIAGNY